LVDANFTPMFCSHCRLSHALVDGHADANIVNEFEGPGGAASGVEQGTTTSNGDRMGSSSHNMTYSVSAETKQVNASLACV
jgi:hypothetical protein